MVKRLSDMTTEEVREILGKPPTVILLPVGSVEPHGPHLPLETDLVISEQACERAVGPLEKSGIDAVVAPSIPYGVTDFARGFKGAVSVPGNVLTPFLQAVVKSLVEDGWSHVCVVNNHFEPANDAAIRDAIEGLPDGRASVACPLSRRWGSMLSDEFKSGACHAGQYETSLMLAADVKVRPVYKSLPAFSISLSKGIADGKRGFVEMGMESAYTGAPANATLREGESLFERLTEMVVAEVTEAIAKNHP